MKDYYALLGIESNATKAEIKKNYRKLASRFHPDKNNQADAASKFIVITEAYDVLSNRKRRAAYDLRRWNKLKSARDVADSFTATVPPRESLRTRRNKAQQKRSIKYHQSSSSQTQQIWLLARESLFIISRYIPHVLGVAVFSVILNSAVRQLADIFNQGVVLGLGVSAFSVLMVYSILKIAIHFYEEFNKDTEACSVFYKLPQGRITGILLSAIGCTLLLLAAILRLS